MVWIFMSKTFKDFRAHSFQMAPQDEVRRLADQVSSIATRLVTLGAETSAHSSNRPVDEVVVRQMLASRRKRDQFFRSDLFADPAWDMLLDLLASRLSDIRVTVTSLCIASNVPATTALRWINTLEQEGLVSRLPDKLDRRRIFVELTSEAEIRLRDYFSSVNCELLI